MGTQGEIYNILGLKLPAEKIEEDRLYRVNGLDVLVDPEENQSGLFHGIPTISVDLDNPQLIIRLEGFVTDDFIRGMHFKDSALVGYVVANESYEGRSTELPSQDAINNLKPKLVRDLKERLNYDAREDQLGLYLVFDWVQGH